MKIRKLPLIVLALSANAWAQDGGLKIFISADMDGVRAHTFSSTNITGLKLNGIEMSKGSMNAAIAGHFGVPVTMVSGADCATGLTPKIVL